MNGNQHATPSEWIDPDDAPELNDEFFERANLNVGDQLVRRGRPLAVSPKVPVTVRYDAEVVAAFKATGKGWQTRMNDALKEWLATHPT